MQRIKSLLIWTLIAILVLIWLPLLALVRLVDRDPTRYRTGYLFRKLGLAMSRVNPFWNITIEGHEGIDDRTPYVIVSNHLSNADIPVISNLPWEMKWVAKRELFEIPFVGWMMKLAGDIPVDRGRNINKVSTFKKCIFYLRKNTSVIFFPEGTRSRDGRLNRFSRGAFELAIREQVPLLPLVIDGTHGCLPKNSWLFKPDVHAKLKILEPIPTKGFEADQVEELIDHVRDRMAEHLMQLRKSNRAEVDALVPPTRN
jgi:1-acyl-sn-glycerol-3-phosphate acyltransferase